MPDSAYADMIAVIYKRIFEEMKLHDIPDTTENRLEMLKGLRDGWMEENENVPEAQPWIMACSMEVLRLTIKRFNEVIGIK